MDPGDWQRKTCNICGVGSEAFIEICVAISIPNPPLVRGFGSHADAMSHCPYSQTTLCHSCWDKYGLSVADTHNRELDGPGLNRDVRSVDCVAHRKSPELRPGNAGSSGGCWFNSNRTLDFA